MTQTMLTPGPWEHGDNGLIYGPCSGDSDEAPFVADVINDPDQRALGIRTPVERANASLIAAAPELYESLIALTCWVEQSHGTTKDGVVADAYALIEKIQRT